MDDSAALIVTSDQASRRMDVDYLDFETDSNVTDDR